jgi:hypothetical protein
MMRAVAPEGSPFGFNADPLTPGAKVQMEESPVNGTTKVLPFPNHSFPLA